MDRSSNGVDSDVGSWLIGSCLVLAAGVWVISWYQLAGTSAEENFFATCAMYIPDTVCSIHF